MFVSALLPSLSYGIGQATHLNSRASHPDAHPKRVERGASRLTAKPSADYRCQTPVNDRVLPIAVVAKLELVLPDSDRQSVAALLGAPYCQLPTLQLRTGNESKRFVYRYDGGWLVVMYEDGRLRWFYLLSPLSCSSSSTMTAPINYLHLVPYTPLQEVYSRFFQKVSRL